MAYNGSGIFSLIAGNPVVTGTVISSTWANNTLTDIANGLTNCLTKDGQTTPTNNIPLGNNKLTGLANGTAAQDAVTVSQLAARGINAAFTVAVAVSSTWPSTYGGASVYINSVTATTQILPLAASVPVGSRISIIVAAAGIATIQRQGTDTISTPTSSTAISFNMAGFDTATLESNGTNNWFLLLGEIQQNSSVTYNNTAGVGGTNQVITNVTGSRAIGTTYSNATAKPIFVSVSFSCSTASGLITYQLNASQCGVKSVPNGSFDTFTFLVPPAANYNLTISTGTFALNLWTEIR